MSINQGPFKKIFLNFLFCIEHGVAESDTTERLHFHTIADYECTDSFRLTAKGLSLTCTCIHSLKGYLRGDKHLPQVQCLREASW